MPTAISRPQIRLDAREPVTSEEALQVILNLLDDSATGVRSVFNVTIDENDVIRGNASIPMDGGQIQYLAFKIDEKSNRIGYKGVDLGRSDSWRDDAATASKKGGKKLNCKNGNIQCGGKCQSAKKNCFAGMTPAQKKAAQQAAKLAKTSGGGSAATATTPPTSPAKTTKAKKSAAIAATPTTTAQASSSPVKVNASELNQKRADLVSRFGQKAVEDAENNVQKILKDSDVFIRVGSSDTLEKILGDRFRTSAELNISTHNIPHLKDDYQTARNRVEEKTLGYDKSTKPDERPIYGYFGGKDLNGRSHKDVADNYGTIAVKLKPEVKDRTTFTGQDSFKSGVASEAKNDGPPPPPNAASLVSSTRHGYDKDKLPSHYPSFMSSKAGDGGQLQAAAKAKDIDDLAPKLATTGNAYVEAQIHGKVRPSDIAEIHFTPKTETDRPTKAIAQFAKDNNVKLLVNGKEVNPDRILAPTKTEQLSDAIDSKDFGKVLSLTDQIAGDASKLRLMKGERDSTLKQLFKDSGYDGLPKVGSADDVTKAWKDGGTLAVRGMGAGAKNRTEFFDMFKTGEYFTGNGIYGNGTYTSAANGTSATAANAALGAIRKHGYAKSGGVTMRFAVQKGANITDAASFTKETAQIRKDFDNWVKAERQRIVGSPSKRQLAKLSQQYEKAYDVSTAKESVMGNTTNQSFRVFNQLYPQLGGMAVVKQVTFANTDPAAFQVARVSAMIFQTQKGQYMATSDGTLVQLKGKSPAAINKEILKNMAAEHAARAAQVGGNTKAVRDFDNRVNRAREVLFGGTGGAYSERLAVIRGYDAIKLTHSYEPNNFMLLLNRSKVIVQSDEIAHDSKKVATGG